MLTTETPRAAVHLCPDSTHFNEAYELTRKIGSGGFATVKLGRQRRTGRHVAVKVVDKSRYAPGDNSLQREIQVLLQVKHPNCIELYEVFVAPQTVYLVMELVTGGELYNRLMDKGNYSEQDASRLIREILQGVSYLHQLGIVHRDLKLENLLLADPSDGAPLKIADFGLSKVFNQGDELQTMCGSPQYVAPEILLVGEAGQETYTTAVDMWSVGVILYILLSGFSPFDDDSDPILYQKIRNGDYSLTEPEWACISQEAKDLVARLLTVDHTKRLTAEAALQHPFVTSGGNNTTAIPGFCERIDSLRKGPSFMDKLQEQLLRQA